MASAVAPAQQGAGGEKETSVIGVSRPVSIREFIKQKSLGVGNFSEIVIAEHRVTHEKFALKILEKKQAADLAKRQHPNVYNEIAMEARVLLQRLPPHEHVVKMYHSFADYNNIYYLMELHNVNTDLWSRIRYQGKMVGCYPSQVRTWMWQLIGALEHLHAHGIVHRDLKPENILLNERNHVVVIDFGTAKDLCQTDLNGPEFVGTPDFMSPEAVTGFSGMPLADGKPPPSAFIGSKPATQAADLWALGSIIYILLTGETPFWSPSPYLAFLRIKRGLLRRNMWGIPDDDTWDLIQKLMHPKAEQRLGFDCYEVKDNKVVKKEGYGVIRNHKYFEKFVEADAKLNPIPTLRDLCVQACAELAKKDAVDLDICDEHPPGDGSSHDMLRLSPVDQKSVLHVLDKTRTFSNGDKTRVLQRFVRNDLEFVEFKIRPTSRDFVGLTQMNDEENKPQSARGSEDPYAKKEEPVPTKIFHLTNPLLLSGENDEADEETRKRYLKGWKKCVANINRTRPKLVVASGILGDKCRKTLSRVSDSIPVVLNDGSAFFSFWLHGFQGMVLQSNSLDGEQSPQMLWLREQMEQCRMAKHRLYCFVDCDPRELSDMVLKRLTRGRVQMLVGLSKSEPFDTVVTYEANETVDDNVSVKSTDSEEDDGDSSSMRMVGTKENGLRSIIVDEKGDWKTEFESVEIP